MTYTTAEYEKARRELERRRKDAEQKQQMRHDEAIAKCPELVKIEQEMAAAGLAAIKALGITIICRIATRCLVIRDGATQQIYSGIGICTAVARTD